MIIYSTYIRKKKKKDTKIFIFFTTLLKKYRIFGKILQYQ